jgi:hypothetical protein
VAVSRRILFVIGAVLGALGVVASVASMALPYIRYRIRGSVAFANVDVDRSGAWWAFQLDRGQLVVAGLLVLGILLVAAWVGTGPLRAVAGVVAPILGLVCALLVVNVVNTTLAHPPEMAAGFVRLNLRTAVAPGAGFGLAAAALLGFGAGLLALGRTPERTAVGSRTAVG